MVRRSLICIGILLAGSMVSAKTPQALKAELDAFLPAETKVRMVWTNGSSSTGPLTVYAYDSEENVIRELTPTSVFGSSRNIRNAYISQDGEYVVLKDKSSDAIQSVKFDGTGKQTLLNQGTLICTWRDPGDGKQCFVASGLPSPSNAGTWAVGITDPSKRRQISTGTFPKTTSQWAGGCGISIDGKMIGGFDYDRPGLWPTPSGAFKPAVAGCQGCNFTMRPTTGTGVYEYGHFFDSHYELCIHNADGSKKELLSNSTSDPGEPWGLEFTNHVNYVTFMAEHDPNNPVLFDLSRTKWVFMKDNWTGSGGNPIAVLLPKGGVETRKAHATARINHAPHSPQKLYSIDGRLLSKSHIGSSTSTVRSLRVAAENQAAGIAVGCR